MARGPFEVVEGAGKRDRKSVIAPKRRRLTDLYVTGKELEFNDGQDDEPIKVWLSKISPLENRDAADTASSVRAGILALKNSPDTDDRRLAVYKEQLEDLGLVDRETMIDYIIAPEVQKALASAEAKIAEEEEWSKDDYLSSLQKAWNDGLSDKFAAEDDNEEAQRVYDELKRYTEQVVAEVEQEREYLRDSWVSSSDSELYEECLSKTIDAEADFAWVNEYSRWQLFYAVRDPEDHKERYFEIREEIDALDPKVLNTLLAEYRELTVDPQEGKD